MIGTSDETVDNCAGTVDTGVEVDETVPTWWGTVKTAETADAGWVCIWCVLDTAGARDSGWETEGIQQGYAESVVGHKTSAKEW